jgi:hypothetical protein
MTDGIGLRVRPTVEWSILWGNLVLVVMVSKETDVREQEATLGGAWLGGNVLVFKAKRRWKL